MRSTYVDGAAHIYSTHVKIIGNPSAMPQVPDIFLFGPGSLIGPEHFWPCRSYYFSLPQLLRIYLSLAPPCLIITGITDVHHWVRFSYKF